MDYWIWVVTSGSGLPQSVTVGSSLVALHGGTDQIGNKNLMWNQNQGILPWFILDLDASLMP
jgi:hypothetical protein